MSKKKTKFPKRLVGVKVPKKFRQFADSRVGRDVVAGAILAAGFAATRSKIMQNIVAKVRMEAGKAGSAAKHMFDDVTDTRDTYTPPRRRSAPDTNPAH